MMNDANERNIRNQLTRYRGVRSINMMKAFAFILVGVIMLYLAATDKFFPNGEIPASATIGKTLGKQGVTMVAVGIAVIAIAIGIIWFTRLLRDLRVGLKEYERALRGGVRIE
jgi:hypothetical protein